MGWTVSEVAVLAVASAAAGAINAVAGGGTLLSFPAAMAVGMPSLVANATNSTALTLASLASAWAYRRELAEESLTARFLLLPSLLGGLGGAMLLQATSPRVFDTLVPMLLLLATALLLVQNLKRRMLLAEVAPAKRWMLWGAQFGVALYGGYFGAGMGIVMLAIFDHLGGGDLHRKNALKMVLGFVINGVAALWLLGARAVCLDVALWMAVAASIGGWWGAALARKVDPRKVRWLVVLVGLVLTAVQARKFWA
ncbi:MAG: sulfite exporter TauE/SafE family protein [Polyangiaceae bacterium]|nr:sulfite exporter TauE/SafE family protein [Polyangiaceae bacterium]